MIRRQFQKVHFCCNRDSRNGGREEAEESTVSRWRSAWAGGRPEEEKLQVRSAEELSREPCHTA